MHVTDVTDGVELLPLRVGNNEVTTTKYVCHVMSISASLTGWYSELIDGGLKCDDLCYV